MKYSLNGNLLIRRRRFLLAGTELDLPRTRERTKQITFGVFRQYGEAEA
ncbi:hypothetical protein [Neorhizobium sp. SOG26]|nr:hypothetical protein [Neorhizobium sp. SOG26]